jgi:PilZ domain-containing protein
VFASSIVEEPEEVCRNWRDECSWHCMSIVASIRCVPGGVEMVKRNKGELRMKQDERSIVRKRTQQLLYLELGRDNGGIMLNLSEDGCSFQAISPVTLGKTRFTFQISGGRRIAGDAEVRWVDEPGIMGGLQFLDLQAEVREQIRMWLNDTRAPQEPGEMPSRETRRSSWPDSSERVMEEPEMSLPSAYMPTAAPPTLPLEDVRARFPLLRGDDLYGASRARSAAMWRGLTMLATVVAACALLRVYQPEVANTLISLGETVTGRPKASAVAPESKSPEPVNPTRPQVNGTPEKAEAETVPNRESEMPPSEVPDLAKPDASRNAERTGSVHEQQAVWHDLGAKNPSGRTGGRTVSAKHRTRAGVPYIQKAESPANESVASLWEGVRGGSVSAELALADRFTRGHGVAKNCDQASVLLRAAANKGDREARLRLYQLDSGGCR